MMGKDDERPPQSEQEDKDEEYFLQAMQDVLPLGAPQQRAPTPLPPTTPAEEREAPAPPTDASSSSSQASAKPLSAEEYGPLSSISFAKRGLPRKVLRSFRKGRLSIRDDLDLHGLTWREARPEVLAFLRTSGPSKYTCLLIIHGKGHGAVVGQATLKSKLYQLLPTLPQVRALQTARPQHGGLGAVYVLVES